jgi:hypothetical protein
MPFTIVCRPFTPYSIAFFLHSIHIASALAGCVLILTQMESILMRIDLGWVDLEC